ncbi:ABC transporter substrate-binding protein [Oceaniglobus trochenteri]|uniref:ABC transporter substrate-binding protein n=1 Tax=Oceaniglobus trochenteri TaxID=2763260 RepID=UPI001CFFBAF7|nr:extracellular solute-binding protein [Oceaniglobus trochenteri]
MRNGLKQCAAAAALLALPVGASAQELLIWHDKGDLGTVMFEDIGKLFAEEHPGVTVRALSFPTDQWLSKSIAALNTNTAPDLLFNDNFRINVIQQSSGKLSGVQDMVDGLDDATRAALPEGALDASTLDGTLLMLPLQQATGAFGVRTSWLEAVGEEYPETWEDVFRIGKKFATEDPDGNGSDDTFGMALQAGNPSVTHQMLELFGFGAGLDHLIIDDEGNVVLDDPRNAKLIQTFLRIFQEEGLVSPDTINHVFTDMYQLIEGGRAGMFRVLDANVVKWDGIEGLAGDYTIGPIPSLFEDEPPAVEMHSVRSIVVTPSSDNPELAAQYAAFALQPESQAIMLKNKGSGVRGDIPLDGLSDTQAFFAKPQYPVNPNDFLSAKFAWYPELQEAFYREISDAIANPPADFDAWIKATAEKMQDKVADLKD